MIERRVLILALGNDLLCDDGVALYAARALRQQFNHPAVSVVESGEAGLALMELMTGYTHVLLLDAIQKSGAAAGQILELCASDFSTVVAPSPHYAGIPEVFAMARRLGIPMPQVFRILAVQVEDPFTISEGLTPTVNRALPVLVDLASVIVRDWLSDIAHTVPPAHAASLVS